MYLKVVFRNTKKLHWLDYFLDVFPTLPSEVNFGKTLYIGVVIHNFEDMSEIIIRNKLTLFFTWLSLAYDAFPISF